MTRTLLRGGVFGYPANPKYTGGKLHLVYEAAPMAFLIEQAGGRATTGSERILGISPASLYQRIPVFLGSEGDVTELEEYLKRTGAVPAKRMRPYYSVN
jgi:fructose-1,6-bisphosphatase I